jgi:hypothetical protein
MKTKKLLYFSLATLGFSATPIYAVCPLCVVAIGAGLGLSKYLGIDDTISGLWIGAMLWALVVITIDWLEKKKWLTIWRNTRNILIILFYYGLTIWPLWEKGFIGQPSHEIWRIDKLILGIIIGTLTLGISDESYKIIKKTNNGHAQFPYQKVVMPIVALLIFSLMFYFLIIV